MRRKSRVYEWLIRWGSVALIGPGFRGGCDCVNPKTPGERPSQCRPAEEHEQLEGVLVAEGDARLVKLDKALCLALEDGPAYASTVQLLGTVPGELAGHRVLARGKLSVRGEVVVFTVTSVTRVL